MELKRKSKDKKAICKKYSKKKQSGDYEKYQEKGKDENIKKHEHEKTSEKTKNCSLQRYNNRETEEYMT